MTAKLRCSMPGFPAHLLATLTPQSSLTLKALSIEMGQGLSAGITLLIPVGPGRPGFRTC